MKRLARSVVAIALGVASFFCTGPCDVEAVAMLMQTPFERTLSAMEQRILDVALMLAFLVAPWMTNRFFLGNDQRYAKAHVVAMGAVVVVLVGGGALLAAVWACFCVGGCALYALRLRATAFSPVRLVAGIPLAFSLIAAVWFVAGTNDLALLGYNRAWSFYAALHGSVLGWLFLGCVAHLANGSGSRRFFTLACCAGLVLFLCVAFGIKGVPNAKRIGVVGLAWLMPAVIARFTLDVRERGGAPLRWSLISLGGVVVTMGLALANEFVAGFPRVALGLPTMVLTHGALNVVVVVPCFLLAVVADSKRTQTFS